MEKKKLKRSSLSDEPHKPRKYFNVNIDKFECESDIASLYIKPTETNGKPNQEIINFPEKTNLRKKVQEYHSPTQEKTKIISPDIKQTSNRYTSSFKIQRNPPFQPSLFKNKSTNELKLQNKILEDAQNKIPKISRNSILLII
jgi:hypothetical protein